MSLLLHLMWQRGSQATVFCLPHPTLQPRVGDHDMPQPAPRHLPLHTVVKSGNRDIF